MSLQPDAEVKVKTLKTGHAVVHLTKGKIDCKIF
jgi:hypothetical protein